MKSVWKRESYVNSCRACPPLTLHKANGVGTSAIYTTVLEIITTLEKNIQYNTKFIRIEVDIGNSWFKKKYRIYIIYDYTIIIYG